MESREGFKFPRCGSQSPHDIEIRVPFQERVSPLMLQRERVRVSTHSDVCYSWPWLWL